MLVTKPARRLPQLLSHPLLAVDAKVIRRRKRILVNRHKLRQLTSRIIFSPSTKTGLIVLLLQVLSRDKEEEHRRSAYIREKKTVDVPGSLQLNDGGPIV